MRSTIYLLIELSLAIISTRMTSLYSIALIMVIGVLTFIAFAFYIDKVQHKPGNDYAIKIYDLQDQLKDLEAECTRLEKLNLRLIKDLEVSKQGSHALEAKCKELSDLNDQFQECGSRLSSAEAALKIHSLERRVEALTRLGFSDLKTSEASKSGYRELLEIASQKLMDLETLRETEDPEDSGYSKSAFALHAITIFRLKQFSEYLRNEYYDKLEGFGIPDINIDLINKSIEAILGIVTSYDRDDIQLFESFKKWSFLEDENISCSWGHHTSKTLDCLGYVGDNILSNYEFCRQFADGVCWGLSYLYCLSGPTNPKVEAFEIDQWDRGFKTVRQALKPLIKDCNVILDLCLEREAFLRENFGYLLVEDSDPNTLELLESYSKELRITAKDILDYSVDMSHKNNHAASAHPHLLLSTVIKLMSWQWLDEERFSRIFTKSSDEVIEILVATVVQFARDERIEPPKDFQLPPVEGKEITDIRNLM